MKKLDEKYKNAYFYEDIKDIDDLVDLDLKLEEYFSDLNLELINSKLFPFLLSHKILLNRYKRRCFSETFLNFTKRRLKNIRLFATFLVQILQFLEEKENQILNDKKIEIKDYLIKQIISYKNKHFIIYFILESRRLNYKIEEKYQKQIIHEIFNDKEDDFINKCTENYHIYQDYKDYPLMKIIFDDNLDELKKEKENLIIHLIDMRSLFYPNKKLKKRIQPISFAAKCGSLNCFNYLLSLYKENDKLDLNICAFAIEGGNEEILNKCMEKIFKEEEITKQNEYFQCIIKACVKYHRYKLFDRFVDEKENEKYGKFSIYQSTFYHNLHCVIKCYNKGSPIEETDPKGRCGDSTNCTFPIHIAGQKHALSIAKQLLDWGCDPDTLKSTQSHPLCWCAGWNDIYITELLLYYGANPNITNEFTNFRHCMHSCCSKNYVDIAKLLFDSGAIIDPIDKKNSTPLLEACSSNHIKTIHFLLCNGANPNQMHNDNKNTPLHMAAKNYLYKVCALLIAYGANPNLLNNEGLLPIDYLKNDDLINTSEIRYELYQSRKVLGYYGPSNYKEIINNMKDELYCPIDFTKLQHVELNLENFLFQ